MNTRELLIGLRQRRAVLKAELDGLEKAIAGLTNAVEGGAAPPQRVFKGGRPNTCIQCNKDFTAKRTVVKFCSKACTSAWWTDDRKGLHRGQQPSLVQLQPARPKGTVLVAGSH